MGEVHPDMYQGILRRLERYKNRGNIGAEKAKQKLENRFLKLLRFLFH
jgi:hypothetical protein